MKKPKTLKKSDLRNHITYLLCPDDSCKRFFDPNDKRACEYECPKQNDLVKIVVCRVCHDVIELPGSHNPFYPIDNKYHTCKDGKSPFGFRPHNEYKLIYKRPK